MKEYTKMKDKMEDVSLELSLADSKLHEIAKEVETKAEAMNVIVKQSKKLQMQVETALKQDSSASATHICPK